MMKFSTTTAFIRTRFFSLRFICKITTIDTTP